jgi:hypothetical protein
VQHLVGELSGREDPEEVSADIALHENTITPNRTKATQILDHLSGLHRRLHSTDHSHQRISQLLLDLVYLRRARDHPCLKEMPPLRDGGLSSRWRCRRRQRQRRRRWRRRKHVARRRPLWHWHPIQARRGGGTRTTKPVLVLGQGYVTLARIDDDHR